MALTVSLPANSQLNRPEYPNAYARVLHALVYATEVCIHICWYEDAAARQRGDQPVHQQAYMITPSDIAGEVFPQAYTYIKSLEEFAGATDC